MIMGSRAQSGRRGRTLVAAAVIVMTVCTACGTRPGSAPNNDATLPATSDGQAAQPTATGEAITAALSDVAPAGVGASAQATLSDGAGDNVSVTLTLGSPAPANAEQDPAVQACGDQLTSNGSTLARSAVIPVRLDATLQTSSPVPMTVNLLNSMSEVFSGRAFQVFTGELLSPTAQDAMPDTAEGAVPMYWATTYGDSGPQCVQAADGDGGTWATVTWPSLAPGAANTWQSWLVIPEQITPGSPALTSAQSQANWFLFQPVATIGQGPATIAYASPRTSIVNCGWPMGAQGTTIPLYVAVDPKTAVARGCKSDA